jgi:hypothetical protein
MPVINPTGMVKNIAQGAAAAAQLPSFAPGPHQTTDVKPIKIGEIPNNSPSQPTKQPALLPGFGTDSSDTGGSGGICSLLTVLPLKNLSARKPSGGRGDLLLQHP